MFNENLKLYRKEKGLSQEQLALKLNVVRQTISKWEKGLSIPDAELLTKLAEILDVSVSDLLGTKIEVTEGKKELDVLANEIAKLNKYIEIYQNKISKYKRKIGIAIGIVIILIFVGSIYDSWTDTWYEFGKNLYHMINDK